MKLFAVLLTTFSLLALSQTGGVIAGLESAGTLTTGSSYAKTIYDALINAGFAKDVGHVMPATLLSTCRTNDNGDTILTDYYAVLQSMLTKAQEIQNRFQNGNGQNGRIDFMATLRALVQRNQQNNQNQNTRYQQGPRSYTTALVAYAAAILTCKMNGRTAEEMGTAWSTAFSAATADGMAYTAPVVVASALMVPDYATTTTATPSARQAPATQNPAPVTVPSRQSEELPTPAPVPQVETTTPAPPQPMPPTAVPN